MRGKYILMIMRALITGSGGLIGYACSRLLCGEGWEVIGVDNNMREYFFGPQGSIAPTVRFLQESFVGYRHFALDIRDRAATRSLHMIGPRRYPTKISM